MSYCGTIMVDHCPAEKLLENILEFVDKVKLQFQLSSIAVWMVPKSKWDLRNFWMLLWKRKISTQASFRLVHCPLHIVLNAFRVGVNIQKYSSTRLVSLRKICVQILEQCESPRQYFLIFLPKTSTFKASVKEIERYKRIKLFLRMKHLFLKLRLLRLLLMISKSF